MGMHSDIGTRLLTIGIINMDGGVISNDIIDTLGNMEDFEVVNTESASIDNLLWMTN